MCRTHSIVRAPYGCRLPRLCSLLLSAWLVSSLSTCWGSAFYNAVSSNGDNSYNLCNLCNIQAPIPVNTPNTIFHPNPINGYASIQGVDVGLQNGAGLTVNAAADLALGATFTQSKATAYVEFMIEPLVIFDSSPIEVLVRGAYGFTDGGSVRATLWRGLQNCEACSGTVRHTLMFNRIDDPNLGIWEANVDIRPNIYYTLKLEATATAVDSTLLIPSSRAFIDPVITTATGEPLTIHFDAGTLTNNPNFVAPDLIPEPSSVLLLAGIVPAWFWIRRGN